MDSNSIPEFQPGASVLRYRDHHDRDPRNETIARVTKTTVVLTNGERYTADGREWGNSNAWFHTRIERLPAAQVAQDTAPVGPAPSVASEASGQARSIVYNDITHRYRAYHDEVIVGDFWTQHDADVALDDYELSLLQDELIDRVPASIYARPADTCACLDPSICWCGAYPMDETTAEIYRDLSRQYTIISAAIAPDLLLARPAEPAEVLYACPCLAPLALTCERCLTGKPESAFQATLAAPLSAPVICDACLVEPAPNATRVLAYCVRCGAPGTTTNQDEDYVCPTCLATPAGDATAATIAAPFVRAPQCDNPAGDGWAHNPIGHTFRVIAGHAPIACPICDTGMPLDQYVEARRAFQENICGEYLNNAYCDDPIAFLAYFDGWTPRTQAAVSHAVAAFLGTSTTDVDNLWLESRERARLLGMLS